MAKKKKGRSSRGFKQYCVRCSPETMEAIGKQSEVQGLTRSDGIRILLEYGENKKIIPRLFSKKKLEQGAND